MKYRPESEHPAALWSNELQYTIMISHHILTLHIYVLPGRVYKKKRKSMVNGLGINCVGFNPLLHKKLMGKE